MFGTIVPEIVAIKTTKHDPVRAKESSAPLARQTDRMMATAIAAIPPLAAMPAPSMKILGA
jgi:hypothetical protein